MFKYRIFQVVMAVAVVILILSTAVMSMFAVRDVSQKSYKLNEDEKLVALMKDGSSEEMTDFTAWLEYSIVSDGFDSGNEDGFDTGKIYMSPENIKVLEIFSKVKSQASNGVFFSLVLLVCCFLVVKRRRYYECIVWGGAAGAIIGLISLVWVKFSNAGIIGALNKFLYKNDYLSLFPGNDAFADIIPENMGTRMIWAYTGIIILGFVITIVVRLIAYRKSKPYKF